MCKPHIYKNLVTNISMSITWIASKCLLDVEILNMVYIYTYIYTNIYTLYAYRYNCRMIMECQVCTTKLDEIFVS